MAGDHKSAPLSFATCRVDSTGIKQSPLLLRSFFIVSSASGLFSPSPWSNACRAVSHKRVTLKRKLSQFGWLMSVTINSSCNLISSINIKKTFIKKIQTRWGEVGNRKGEHRSWTWSCKNLMYPMASWRTDAVSVCTNSNFKN